MVLLPSSFIHTQPHSCTAKRGFDPTVLVWFGWFQWPQWLLHFCESNKNTCCSRAAPREAILNSCKALKVHNGFEEIAHS